MSLMLIRSNNTFVNKTAKTLLPLSVCPCSSNSSYNCYMANVYAVYPGQVLHINLIISPRWSEPSSTIIAANTKDDYCSILDSYQLSQTHTNNGCNRYSYTIWPTFKLLHVIIIMQLLIYMYIKMLSLFRFTRFFRLSSSATCDKWALLFL